MPKFTYTVRDNTGAKVTGSEEASSTDELVARLQAKNFIIVNIAPESKETKAESKLDVSGKPIKFKHYRVTQDDLVLLCRQLATLLAAGVTILKSLNVISQQASSQRFYNVMKDLEKSMERGLSLHEAMSKHPKLFSELWVNLVESGEASGNLAIVLDRLASYLERNASFKRRVISSLIYPLILLFAGTGALLFLTTKIIPTFAELFKGFNIPLPVLTQILIVISDFIRKSALIILGVLIVSVFMIKRYIDTKDGRRRSEELQFRLPMFGEFFRALVVERFSSEISTLIGSGVPLLYSLEITEHSVGNLIMGEIIGKIKEDVREGRPLSLSLEKSGFFEPMVIQMVSVGEEIGELPQMFKRVNAFYQEYVETFLTRFTVMFEPLMLVFMGLVIGLMVVGMFLPIFQIASIGTR